MISPAIKNAGTGRRWLKRPVTPPSQRSDASAPSAQTIEPKPLCICWCQMGSLRRWGAQIQSTSARAASGESKITGSGVSMRCISSFRRRVIS